MNTNLQGFRLFRAPDGGSVALQAPGYDLSKPWSATIRIRTQRPYAGTPDGLNLREFHIARTGNYDRVVKFALEGHWIQRLESRGGNFMIARSNDSERAIAIWRGRWHEIATTLVLPESPASEALRRFDGLRFVDHPQGLTVQPQHPGHTVDVLDIFTHIPGVGFLSIMNPRWSLQIVPRWSGAKVPSGEVWKHELAQGGESSDAVLVHATRSVVAVLHGERDTADLAPRLRFLERVTELSWSVN